MSPFRRGLALLLLVTAAAYVRVAGFAYVWDDLLLIVGNPLLTPPVDWGALLTSDLWEPVQASAPPFYRPVVAASFAVDRVLLGGSPAAAHLHSLAWHLLAVGLVAALLQRLRPGLPALAGAAVFALHPLQSEAVAFVAARNDPMAAALGVGALLILWPRDAGPLRLLVGAGLAAAAMLAKESVVLLPVVLALLDAGHRGRPGGWGRYGALVLGIGAVLGLRAAVGLEGSERFPDAAQLAFALARVPDGLALLGARTILPWPLSTGYRITYLDLPPLQVVAGGVALAALVAVIAVRGRRLGVAGLLVGALALAPALAAAASVDRLAERYLYLPFLGLAVAVAAAWPADPRAARRLALPAGVVLLGWVLLLQVRLPDWRSDAARVTSAARATPNPYTLWVLGELALEQGDPPAALAHFEQAIALPGPVYQTSCRRVQELAVVLGVPERGAALALAPDVRCKDPDGLLRPWEVVTLGQAGHWEEVARRTAGEDLPRPDLWGPARVALLRREGRAEEAAALVEGLVAGGLDRALLEERVAGY